MAHPRWGALFLWILVLSACGASDSVKLEDLVWTDADARALTRNAVDALDIPGIEWKHGETPHFVFHFEQRWMAERAAAEAETYYNLIKGDLKVTDDTWEVKGHIFLFEAKEKWKSFIEKTGVDRWSGGVCMGNEIFLLSPPAANPFTGGVLPHEMTHLIVNRFVRGRLPVWLNEGVAEQQGRKHFAGYTRPKGYSFLPSPNVVSEANYMPLEELTQASDYPSDPSKVTNFYRESVRLVQFLIEDHSKQDFLQFMQEMADGKTFAHALDRVYGNIYPNLEAFETKFKGVAVSKVKLLEDSSSTD